MNHHARSPARRLASAAAVSIAAASALPAQSHDSHDTLSDPIKHICFIFMEDMGLQIGPYGDHTVPTPNLDRFEQQSATFESAYCTSATCSPSRASIFTGLYPHQNGHYGLASNPGKPEVAQWGYRLHEGTPTLTPMLHDAGFATAYTYKVHVGPEEAVPFDRSYRWEDFNALGQLMTEGTQIAAFMRSFYDEEVNEDTPRMFFMAQSTDTHRPFAWKGGGHNRPLEYQDSPYRVMTAEDEITLPYFGPDIPRDENMLQDVADYYNAVQRVDKVVGETLDTLDEMGIADETIVVFSSDHGPPFSRGKVSIYDLGGHVPLMVRWPGVSEPGSRIDQPVSLVDFMPTVLDATGLDIPDHMAGHSWRDVLTGAASPDRSEYAVSEFHAHMTVNTYWPSRSITDGRWKLNLHMLADRSDLEGVVTDNPSDFRVGRNAPPGTVAHEIYSRLLHPPRYELFDLRADPYEWHDLSDNSEFVQEKQRLITALEEWQRRTADPFRDQRFLDAFTQHYQAGQQRAEQWSADNDKPFWANPRVLDGDQSRWTREWSEVEPELEAARNGNPPEPTVPAP